MGLGMTDRKLFLDIFVLKAVDKHLSTPGVMARRNGSSTGSDI